MTWRVTAQALHKRALNARPRVLAMQAHTTGAHAPTRVQLHERMQGYSILYLKGYTKTQHTPPPAAAVPPTHPPPHTPQALKASEAMHALKRVGEADEVAAALEFLLLPSNRLGWGEGRVWGRQGRGKHARGQLPQWTGACTTCCCPPTGGVGGAPPSQAPAALPGGREGRVHLPRTSDSSPSVSALAASCLVAGHGPPASQLCDWPGAWCGRRPGQPEGAVIPLVIVSARLRQRLDRARGIRVAVWPAAIAAASTVNRAVGRDCGGAFQFMPCVLPRTALARPGAFAPALASPCTCAV